MCLCRPASCGVCCVVCVVCRGSTAQLRQNRPLVPDCLPSLANEAFLAQCPSSIFRTQDWLVSWLPSGKVPWCTWTIVLISGGGGSSPVASYVFAQSR